PVFGVTTGALPETMGRTGGAVLVGPSDPRVVTHTIVALLRNPERLADLGHRGREYVTMHYSLDELGDRWERMLTAPSTALHRMSGAWSGPRGARYWIETVAGACAMGWALDAGASWARSKR